MIDRKRYLYRKTVKGRLYLFFRHKGKLTPLPADEGNAEFCRAYDAAMRAVRLATATAVPVPSASPPNARMKFLPGTLGAAIEQYLYSAAYDRLAPSSKVQYLQTLKQLHARASAPAGSPISTPTPSIFTPISWPKNAAPRSPTGTCG